MTALDANMLTDLAEFVAALNDATESHGVRIAFYSSMPLEDMDGNTLPLTITHRDGEYRLEEPIR